MAATAAAPLQQHKPQPLETFQSGNFQTFQTIRSVQPLSFHMTPTAARPATSSTGGSGNFGSSGSGNWGSMGSVKVTPTSAGVNPTGSFRLSPNSSRRWVENTPVASTPLSLWPPTPSPSGFTHVTSSIQHPAVSSGYTVVQHQPQGGGADSGPKLPVNSQATVITTQAPTETTTTTAAPAPATGAAPQMMQQMVFISMPVPMPQQGQVVMQMPQMQQVPMQGVQGVQGVQGQPMMVMAPQPAAATVRTLQAVPEASHGVSTSITTAPGSAISPKPSVVTTMTRTVLEAPPVTIASSSMNVEGGATAPAMSLGSSLHSVGKCSPCAWYWKPKGCSVGANCDFCHLCPKGELNNRKKAKVAAMRMGIIPPGTRTAPRVA